MVFLFPAIVLIKEILRLFSLLDVEKPNIESMSDEDFKGFVQKVNDAYLKHNNNDITRDIKGQKIRKAIANREKEKQELRKQLRDEKN